MTDRFTFSGHNTNNHGSGNGFNSINSSSLSANGFTTVPSMTSPVPMLSPANNQSSNNISGTINNVMNNNCNTGTTVANNVNQTPTNSVGVSSNQVSNTGSSISGIGSNFEDSRNALKYWNYCAQLSKYMHEESLLDRQEFLNWILELLDKMRTQTMYDESLKKLILTFAMQYMQDFVQSERLCRRMAYIIAKQLSYLLNAAVEQQQMNGIDKKHTQNITNGSVSTKILPIDNDDVEKKKCNIDPFENAINEYMNCPHHRDIILLLSTALQIITIECPTAMVWCGIGENRTSSILCGSPLDHLPIAPSALPMPNKCPLTNADIRGQLQITEAEIILRSKHAENRWFAEKWQNNSKNLCSHFLTILDNLDTHCFDRMDLNNCIDSLYSNIFQPFVNIRRDVAENGETKEISHNYDAHSVDGSTVKILCEWAVSSQRCVLIDFLKFYILLIPISIFY